MIITNLVVMNFELFRTVPRVKSRDDDAPNRLFSSLSHFTLSLPLDTYSSSTLMSGLFNSALAPFTVKGFYLLTWGTALGSNVWNTVVSSPLHCHP